MFLHKTLSGMQKKMFMFHVLITLRRVYLLQQAATCILTLADLKMHVEGQAASRAALKFRQAGFEPDVIICHAGFGNGLYLKDVFPEARRVGFFGMVLPILTR